MTKYSNITARHTKSVVFTKLGANAASAHIVIEVRLSHMCLSIHRSTQTLIFKIKALTSL